VTRDAQLPPDDGDDPVGPSEPLEPRIGTTPPALLGGLALLGLVGGWALRPVSVWLDRPAPRVGAMPAFALLLVAALVAWTAWTTYSSIHRRHPARDAGLAPLAPHQAVNRLALGKACALIGALVAGGYLGYCLSWVGLPAQAATPRVVRGLAAAVAAGLLVAAGLALERACRVRNDEE
jgi:hypothetical protein